MFHRKWLVNSSYFFINVLHVHVICEHHFWRNIFTSYLATLLKIILLNLNYGYKKLNLNIYVFKRLRTLVLPTFNLFFYERYKLTMLSAMFFFFTGPIYIYFPCPTEYPGTCLFTLYLIHMMKLGKNVFIIKDWNISYM